jgi:hypothetical protein
MDVLEQARLALRKYLKENPDKVKKDLVDMRNKSKGLDFWDYLTKLSGK